MANSIKLTKKTEWYRETVAERPGTSKTYSISTTSELVNETTQVVGTTHELIALGDATDDCYAEISHAHATAIVQVGVDDGGVFVPLIDIPPSYPPAIIPRVSTLASTYLKSDTASTSVKILLCKIV